MLQVENRKGKQCPYKAILCQEGHYPRCQDCPVYLDYQKGNSKTEEECESCGIVIGGVEEHYISEYREHQICSWCINQWKHREELVGYTLSYEQFSKGKIE